MAGVARPEARVRPVWVAWLLARGCPGAVVLRYFELAALATVLGSVWALALARRDGAREHVAARALAAAYLGALLGGYAFEWLRKMPEAMLRCDLGVLLGAGRAAWGGLWFGALAAFWVLRRAREPVGAFFDRAAPGTGLIFVLVRLGCFLEGCDYGQVTARWVGVRFPPGSLAALDHAARGFVPMGAASLPVHPTQLYECALGAAGACVALAVRRLRCREGAAFASFLAVYALGRGAIETLRGDAARGHLGGLSTAQWVSVLSVALVAAWWARRGRRWRVARASLLCLMALGGPASAQAVNWSLGSTRDPGAALASPANAPGVPPQGSATAPPPRASNRLLFRLSVGPGLSLGRRAVPHGLVAELLGGVEVALTPSAALAFGLELRTLTNEVASHNSVGLPVLFVRRWSERFETVSGLSFQYTAIAFRAGFFDPTTAVSMRLEIGGQLRLGARTVLGFSPFTFGASYGDAVGFLGTWEPRAWAAFTP
ncbi:MAG: prolipoprotein diacylglyceryl transferase [Myxococcales bacterium]|nr:prolipoprotein diacylglyceryl transferase [Myxococcales bacterium]